MERKAATKVQRSSGSYDVQRRSTSARSRSSANPLLEMQRSIGNQAIHRLINSHYIQTKLQVSTPGDPFEREADRVADSVMRMPSPEGASATVSNHTQISRIQRKCLECEKEAQRKPHEQLQRQATVDDDDEMLQEHSSGPSGASADVQSQVSSLKGAGGPLPQSVRTFFEPRLGYDFSGVRIHIGAAGAMAARSVNARAFTVGKDIAFGTGQYAPESNEGKRLLAHELVHTIQQGASPAGPKPLSRPYATQENISLRSYDKQVQRQIEPNKKCPKGAAVTGNAAKNAAKFIVSGAQNGAPCACLLVIHNNEENARKTAQLMHQHCTYNLALVESGAATRCIRLPGHAVQNFDPNEFFGPETPKQCLNDEKSCTDFLNTKGDTTDVAEIEKFVEITFFLALKDCSNNFSLPVVALHNNDIEDTKNYRAKKEGKDVSDLEMDITKGEKKDDPTKLKPLKDLLKDKFGQALQKGLTDEAGKTNIFRWCASEELSRCHIGDPNQPDRVIWTTKKSDFDDLSAKKVNVVLQEDPSRVGIESKTDLSTLFLSLKGIMGSKLDPEITKLTQEIAAYHTLHSQAVLEKTTLEQKEANRPKAPLEARPGTVAGLRIIVLAGLLDFYLEEIKKRSTSVIALQLEKAKFSNLRFINIETPIHKLENQSDAGRKKNYEFIVEALKAVKLHCCGGKEPEAEAKVKEGLTLKGKAQ